MAQTSITDVFNPEILNEAVEGVFNQKTAFMGSLLARLGAVVVSGTMPEGGPSAVGQTITVPYFGTIGSFVSNPDGSSVTPSKVGQATETATITRESLGFEVSRWAQANAAVNPNVGDPYEEGARQIMVAAERSMDSQIITAAAASGIRTTDVYSTTVPEKISWDLVVDAKFNAWGDEQEDVVGMIAHSHTRKDMIKLKDSTGAPLLVMSQREGDFDRFAGLPVVTSDRVPITGSTMGAVTSSGTTPPVATLAGTPLGPWNLVIDALTGDATTLTFRFSTDGGNTWSATLTALDDSVPVALTDTAVDSLVGVNGATGLTVAFAAGTFNADNMWTATAQLKATTLIVKKAALAFWYNQQLLKLETDKDIWKHTDQAAMHLYAAAHRYRRVPMGTKPGVTAILHNVSGY